MKTKLIKTIVILLLILSIPYTLLAQEGGGIDQPSPCDNGETEDCPQANAPLDSWLVLLLGAGAAYGFVRHGRQQKISME